MIQRIKNFVFIRDRYTQQRNLIRFFILAVIVSVATIFGSWLVGNNLFSDETDFEINFEQDGQILKIRSNLSTKNYNYFRSTSLPICNQKSFKTNPNFKQVFQKEIDLWLENSDKNKYYCFQAIAQLDNQVDYKVYLIKKWPKSIINFWQSNSSLVAYLNEELNPQDYSYRWQYLILGTYNQTCDQISFESHAEKIVYQNVVEIRSDLIGYKVCFRLADRQGNWHYQLRPINH